MHPTRDKPAITKRTARIMCSCFPGNVPVCLVLLIHARHTHQPRRMAYGPMLSLTACSQLHMWLHEVIGLVTATVLLGWQDHRQMMAPSPLIQQASVITAMQPSPLPFAAGFPRHGAATEWCACCHSTESPKSNGGSKTISQSCSDDQASEAHAGQAVTACLQSRKRIGTYKRRVAGKTKSTWLLMRFAAWHVAYACA